MKLTYNRQLLPIYIVIGCLVLMLIIYFISSAELNLGVVITVGWLLIITLFLWFGNTFISKFLDKELPWQEYLTLRFFIQLLASLIYALICVNASYLIFKLLFTQDPPSPEQLFMVNVYSILLILPVFSIYYVIYFIREWKKSKIESELFQKESMKSQLANLKNHLDPHFLFNNLNILSTLIEKGEENSKEYLNKFAEVYRYMLQNNAMELIPLCDELDFIQSYLQLIKMRFQQGLTVLVNIPEEKFDFTLPPLTLQMLVENCIKHNSLSVEHPLSIEIKYLQENYLQVKNNIIAKKIRFHSNGSGLQNIINRYKYFTEQEVRIENDGAFFSVEVPLLELEEL